MLRIECYDRTEIRMGSPYSVCRIRISGDWVPELPTSDRQDTVAVREGGTAAAVVRWDVPANVSGFRICVLDEGSEAPPEAREARGGGR